MSTTIDFQNMQEIEAVTQSLGETECRRLGFIFDDERGVTTLSTAGFGYWVFVKAAEETTLSDAFAA